MAAPGIYRHYKGGQYRALFVAVHSTNNESIPIGSPMVVYVSLNPDHGGIHVRRESQWSEQVRWPDGIWRSRFLRESEFVLSGLTAKLWET